ncbi:MAG: inosine-uridine nucleoside N-ribohydrolase [Candidatus Poriferisodalaceae bacterium]|jgi:inosine-uridine nucleoside N-ribohydrolase
MAPKIIIDCDPGHDDAMALLMAGQHTEILGITVVSGNAPLEATVRNTLIMSQVLGLDAPVHAGAARPLLAPPRHATHVHGITGLDGPAHPELNRTVESDDAVGFIIDTIRSNDDVWLVPIGPLTNIALALRQAPDIADQVAGISIMGGSATVGNVTSTGEFNVWADPDAAAIVFECGAKILMAGLNLTHQFCVTQDTIDALRLMDSTVSNFSADLFDFYLKSNERQTSRAAAPLHDPCAVMAITHPELFEFQARHVVVETQGRHTRGMTVVDERGYGAEQPNVEVEYGIHAEAAMSLFLDSVRAYG